MSTSRTFPTGSRRDSADGKAPLSKLPFTALGEVALVHGYGDIHYGVGNWRKGQFMSTFVDSGLRHATAANRGESIDAKSGRRHLAMAAWNFLIALHQDMHPEQYAHLDDRMDDFGNWVSEVFAKTDVARALASGDLLAEAIRNEASRDRQNGNGSHVPGYVPGQAEKSVLGEPIPD